MSEYGSSFVRDRFIAIRTRDGGLVYRVTAHRVAERSPGVEPIMPQTPTRTRFELRPSRALVLWLAGAIGGGVLAAWGSALPPAAAGALSVLAAASLVRGLRLHALRSARDAVIRIALEPEIRIGFRDGRECGARLREPPLVHPWLVALPLETDRGRMSVLVPSDSLASPAEHKRMRVCLRLGGAS